MNENEIYTVFIAEDEQPARELLIEYLFKWPELKLDGWAKNGQDALQKLSNKKYNILFLDINLPVMTGIEVIERLIFPPYIIFTTANDRYAIKAFELGAVDYLLKPFTEARFNQAVEKTLRMIRDRQDALKSPMHLGLSFKENENHFFIPYEDIIYLCSSGRHTIIYTKGREYDAAQALIEFSGKLPNELFMRIHKQYIVNLKYISHVQYLIGGQYIAFLKDSDETTLTVGRCYAGALREKLIF